VLTSILSVVKHTVITSYVDQRKNAAKSEQCLQDSSLFSHVGIRMPRSTGDDHLEGRVDGFMINWSHQSKLTSSMEKPGRYFPERVRDDLSFTRIRV
jgi:hypothetical protein